MRPEAKANQDHSAITLTSAFIAVDDIQALRDRPFAAPYGVWILACRGRLKL